MSEGADSVTQTCGDSLTILEDEGESNKATATVTPTPPPLPLPSTYTGRRPRFGTGCIPPSPYVWIDGRQLRSALAWTKKWPPRRVSFPTNDNHLVTGYLEPANPWQHAENVSREDLAFAYKESCARHSTEPLQNVLNQLENLDISQDRCPELNLKGEVLDQDRSEPLEEILKRVQFYKINLEETSLNEESSIILFDMLEYYESAKYLNISCNPEIGVRGWQACSHLIKKTQCLEQLEARDIKLHEHYMNILSRALRLVCHLHVLKLENCGLSGRAIITLVAALKVNSGIRELYLADNGLDLYDAIQLGSLLRMNNHLQLLDISNNNVQDDGVRDILEGLINQVNEDKTGKGLSILILWNNRLTKKSSPYFSRIIALSKTLETLNIGQNMLTDEMLNVVNEALKNNRVLLQLGMQSTELTCEGIITLAEIMEVNQVLQRIDLRENNIQMAGMHALVNVLKKNTSVTQIDLDDKPRMKIDGPLHEYVELVTEIRNCCNENEKQHLLGESTEDVESPQHSSRLLNASSRKISLTCQTLPSPSRPTVSLVADESARTMLEPKRTSGGRLRSPAPSPIPSPVASPIPSPSRNRFVVSRVPEASLRSADSSTSSSPVTPSSLGSSPICFFPSGSSRFRVSIVEPVNTTYSSPKAVVASSNRNVTIGFNFRVDMIESADSDDSDNATKADAMTQNVSTNIAIPDMNTLNIAPVTGEMSCENIVKSLENYYDEEIRSKDVQLSDYEIKIDSEKNEDITTTYENGRSKVIEIKQTQLTQDTVEVQSDRNEDMTILSEKNDVIVHLESDAAEDSEMYNYNIQYTSTKELQIPAYPNAVVKNPAMRVNTLENDALDCTKKSSLDNILEPSLKQNLESFSSNVLESSINTSLETPWTDRADSPPQQRISTSVQRPKSNLEKLLSLFQHPGQLFSDSSYTKLDTSSSQENTNSVTTTLVDKLQEEQNKVNIDISSSEHVSPLKNKSIKVNVSQLQNLSDIHTSLKLKPRVSSIEHDTKFLNLMKYQDTLRSENSLEKSTEITRNNENNLCEKNGDKENLMQENSQIKEDNDDDSINEHNSQVIKNEDILSDQEKNRVGKNEKYLLDQNRSQVTQDTENNQDQEKDRITGEIVNNLTDKEESQISNNDNEMLFDQEKNSITKNNENNQESNQIATDNENNSCNQEKNSNKENDERDLIGETKSQIPLDNKENLLNQKGIQDLMTIDEKDFKKREKNQVVEDDKDLSNQEKRRNNQEDNRIMKNDEKSFTEDSHINFEENACNVDTMIESDRNNLPLPESVQSKNNLFNKDLVLGNDRDTVVPLLLAGGSTVCVAVESTDIPEYSVLELSQIDDLECNDAKRLEGNLTEHFQRFQHCDDYHRQECNDAENLVEHSEYDDARPLKCNYLECLKCYETKCLECDSTVEEVMMKRTCDTITTDSINQTSDSSFPICNIVRDRRDTNSLSVASVPTSAATNDVDMTMSTQGNESILPMSLDIRANNYLNNEVTNNTPCVANKGYSDDFTMREDSVGVFDDACRETTHRRSTSIDIKIEEQISNTSRSTSTDQDAPGRIYIHESYVPNNVNVYRTKDVSETDCMENDVNDDKQIDSSIFVTPYEISVIQDKSDAEEFIFCMTDISTDGTTVDDELSSGIPSRSLSNDVVKETDSFFELPTATRATTLLIDDSDDVHRNSQDSGIEETALTTDDSVTTDSHPLPPPRESLQESVDSGIESECSSICVKTESTVERTSESAAILKRSSYSDNSSHERDDHDVADDDGDDEDLVEFSPDFLANEGRSTANDITHSAGTVIAHSTTTVHDTSSK